MLGKKIIGIRYLLLALACLLSPLASLRAVKSFDSFIRYDQLDHTLSLERLRAGNHDEGGQNEYYFTLDLHALAIKQEDRNKEIQERQKITRSLGNFAEIKIKALSTWTKEGNGSMNIKIEGDLIREITSEAMRSFELEEDKISIAAEIKLFEKAKQFYFLGEDRLIKKTVYYIIPETMPHGPDKSNRTLTLIDDKGAYAEILVSFNGAEDSKKK